ncbi:MAG: CehA/McbA family metallohydrolase [Verrucomicrobiales bacterium]|nr:CehA/McbA family metallohydrolase [Verrucomicrobiales bacterium]
MRHAFLWLVCHLTLGGLCGRAVDFPEVRVVEAQPLAAQARRIASALEALGTPLSASEREALDTALRGPDDAVAAGVQAVFDRHSLFGVNINPEMRVKVAVGPAQPELDEGGWRVFLVKVHNESGTTARLKLDSPNARKLHESPAEEVRDRWLAAEMFDQAPLTPALSGLELEYRVVQLYSRDAGRREAKVSFNVGQGTQDLGFRNEVDLLFECQPAITVPLEILDDRGEPTTAALLVRDARGRVYPSPAKRLAPDFFFHPQIYRSHGESLRLPEGQYTVELTRGPESILQQASLSVTQGVGSLKLRAQRWIDPAAVGWWSGDHHIHAAGCAHYNKPTEGVHAPDMFRHCVGEDLKIGANLTWGPCFDYQKQFFTGAIDKVSRYPYLLRYDVEVSGFGSHRSGHLCLLRLREQMPPGGTSMSHWPTLCLNTLRWAKKQGALCGPAHSGWGLQVETSELPNYVVPPFDGIGANEYIVDVTHVVPGPDGRLVPAVDFLSTVDTPYVWELNIWYHTLNCGYRTRISGETDFPCIYGERVGLGRSYVQLDGRLDYDDWCEGIRAGRNYVGDGRSHLIDFAVEQVRMGRGASELRLGSVGEVRVTAQVAARLDETPDEAVRRRSYSEQPYWHLERARLGQTREVPVELVVNGRAVARQNLVADGVLRPIEFMVPIERSSWVAMRILPSSHTNPVWVMVGDQPVRPSRRSAQWCLDGVDRCWSQKERLIAPAELEEARAAYEHARVAYRRILAESLAD